MKNPFRSVIELLYTKEQSKDAPPLADYGVKLLLRLLWQNPWYLIKLNFITLLSCILIVTIPAAMLTLRINMMELIRHNKRLSVKEYFITLKKSVFRIIPFSLLCLLLVACSVSLVWKFWEINGIASQIIVAFSSLLFLYAYLLWNYGITLMAETQAPIITSVKDSFILISSMIKNDVLLIAFSLGLNIILILLLPYTIPVYLLLSFSLTSLISSCILKLPAEMVQEAK